MKTTNPLQRLFGLGGQNRSHTCVLIDYENIAIEQRGEAEHAPLDLEPLLETIRKQLPDSRLVTIQAFADWRHFPKGANPLTRLGVQTIQAPSYRHQGKNATDIQMAVAAVDLLHLQPKLETFVLVTGDSDFTPLVHLLKDRGKQVIGLGRKGTVSRLLEEVVDEFMLFDRLPVLGERKDTPASRKPQPQTAEPSRPRENVSRSRPVERVSAQKPARKRPASVGRNERSPQPERKSPAKEASSPEPSSRAGVEAIVSYGLSAERTHQLLQLSLEVCEMAQPQSASAMQKALATRYRDKLSGDEAKRLSALLSEVNALGRSNGGGWLSRCEGGEEGAFDMLIAAVKSRLKRAGRQEARDAGELGRLLFGHPVEKAEFSMRIVRGEAMLHELGV